LDAAINENETISINFICIHISLGFEDKPKIRRTRVCWIQFAIDQRRKDQEQEGENRGGKVKKNP
jgi:hypothetical protein